MNFDGYFTFLRKVFGLIPFGIFDLVILVAMSFYIFEDANFGLVASSISFVSIFSAFLLGLIFYHPVSELIINNFSVTKGVADVIAFLIVSVFSYLAVSFALTLLRKRFVVFSFPKNLDRIGGAIFGFLSFVLIASFAVALVLSFPFAGAVKDSIRNSVSGKYLFSKMQGSEYYVRQIFGGAIDETINFLTIKPESNEAISLNFKTDKSTKDEISKLKMFEMVNAERQKNGLNPVELDDLLTQVASLHGEDMLREGYFSHYTPDGKSPFDRMDEYNVVYVFAGENLAFAPDVNIAMAGLMKSVSHRDNILSKSFNKIGIGVLDAGVHGKIFVQEFSD